MRARLAILPVLLLAVVVLFPAPVAGASPGHRISLSQADPAEQTDKETTQEATPEPGPLWTYQMAWMSFALLLVVLLGAGFWYYRFVVTRQRG
jgi:hypothetical protein